MGQREFSDFRSDAKRERGKGQPDVLRPGSRVIPGEDPVGWVAGEPELAHTDRLSTRDDHRRDDQALVGCGDVEVEGCRASLHRDRLLALAVIDEREPC